MCDKSVESNPCAMQAVPELFKIQEMCDKAFSKNPFKLKYCLDRYDSRRNM